MRDMSICTEKNPGVRVLNPFSWFCCIRNVTLRFLMFERYVFELIQDILKYLSCDFQKKSIIITKGVYIRINLQTCTYGYLLLKVHLSLTRVYDLN